MRITIFDLITALWVDFSKLLEKLIVKYPSKRAHFKEISVEDFMRGIFNDACAVFSSDFHYKSIMLWVLI